MKLTPEQIHALHSSVLALCNEVEVMEEDPTYYKEVITEYKVDIETLTKMLRDGQ